MHDIAASHFSSGDTVDVRRHLALEDAALMVAFDRLCRFAVAIVGVPIAVVAILDREHEVLRGGVATWGALGSVRTFPLASSFCQHLPPTGEPLAVDNAQGHPEMSRYLPVCEYGVVAYLGIPLVCRDSSVLGSICLMDYQPRTWTQHDIAQLQDLAASVLTEIELRYQLQLQHRLERVVHERDTFLQRLLERFPGGSVNVFDPDLRYLFVAGRGLEQHGISAHDLIGKRLVDVMPADTVRGILPYYRQVLAGEPVDFEVGREDRTFTISASPLHDADRSIRGIVAVVYESTVF